MYSFRPLGTLTQHVNGKGWFSFQIIAAVGTLKVPLRPRLATILMDVVDQVSYFHRPLIISGCQHYVFVHWLETHICLLEVMERSAPQTAEGWWHVAVQYSAVHCSALQSLASRSIMTQFALETDTFAIETHTWHPPKHGGIILCLDNLQNV